MKEDPKPELYKLLICKLGLDSIRNPASKLDFFPWFVSTKPCSYSKKPNVQKLMQSQPSSANSRPCNVTLPSSAFHKYFNRRDALKRSERFAALNTPLVMDVSGCGSMLHLGYSTTKIYSGSNFPFPDDDDGIDDQNDYIKDDYVEHRLGFEYSMKDHQFDGCFKNNHPYSPSKLASDVGRKFKSPRFLDQDFHSPKDYMQLPATNRLSLVNIDVRSNDDDDECWKTFNLTTPESGGATTFNEEGKEVTKTPNSSTYRKTNYTMGKSSKLPVEKHARKDQNESNKKLYPSPLQLSPFGGKSIKDEELGDESFKDILETQKCVPLERSYSELDELCVEEIEGESPVAKLRRQVQFDRKTIIKLYEEIDEERNAAAEAASQAMAMMTKLQEEKALINLDALQCLRLMEEQAEHDSDALEQANVLLTDKEKEIQDLTAELEFYRMKYPDAYREEHIILQRPQLSVMCGCRKDFDVLHTPRMEIKEDKCPPKP